MKAYLKVNEEVAPHPNLIISIKHCEGDFHRGNSFSKVIGQGRHKQIIEVQCAREYEGKGAYPNYIANGVIEGFEEHLSMEPDKINSLREFTEKRPELYSGIWTWSRGGGWGGPYIKNELWCELNAWVMAQWAADPSQSEEEVFKRYVSERLHLKGDDIDSFRRLCLLSAEAVIRGRNTTHRDMNPWWTRDQGIGWPVPTKDAEGQQRNLMQKDESVAKWREIIKLAKKINWPDEETQNYVVGSCYYGLRLYEIYRSIVYLSDAQLREDRKDLKKWIKVYDAAWKKYHELPDKFSSLASLYTKDYSRFMGSNADKKVEELRKELVAGN
ncbi:hypothetical protein ACT29H_05890 [Thermophagus sp. OGC60D27]|uniref:hypothetical protein n=1 Tax=Thermophagus sp. OGC60D27 TaxID=3458415 RepID=UPI0040377296